jgi:acyl-CoA dehydrogenase
MSASLGVTLLLVLGAVLLVVRAPAWSWSLSGTVLLALAGYFHPEPAALWPAALLWLAIGGFIHGAPLRRRFFSEPIAQRLRGKLPKLSRTEREALEAGGVWWDAELLGGRPRWERLFTLPMPLLTQQEQAFLDGPVETLCAMLDDWRITSEWHDLPPEVWDYLRREGFFGLIIPREYGGLEFSALAHSAVVLKIASRSISAAVTQMVPNSLGPAKLILHYGTQQQKDHWLPRLARGEEIPCFGLTSPEAGSDAAAMTDRGVVCRGVYQGRETLGIRLDFAKRYITLGPVATVIGLAFKLDDPDQLLGEKMHLGITLALVPADTPGVVTGSRHAPMNLSFQNGPVQGHDVFIPLENVIGGAGRAGQGWRMLMECLAEGRSISLPALACGAAKLTARVTGAYARIRRQFHQPIGQFEGINEVLGRIAGRAYQMDATRLLTLAALDQGERPAVISALVKYHLTERMRTTVNDGMDVLGGAGICLGPSNLLGRVYQAVPISITVEGANILTRNLIVFGQGAIRCHPYLLKELEALTRDDAHEGSIAFDRALRAHLGFLLGNGLRALWLALGGGVLARPHGMPAALRQSARRVARLSAALSLVADAALLTLGGALKRRERLSAQLGDALALLYLASAMLRLRHERGCPENEAVWHEWGIRDALAGVVGALDGALNEFPSHALAWALRRLIFPLGRPSFAPDGRLTLACGTQLQQPGPAREQLTQGLYQPHDLREALARLEDAYARTLATTTLEERLRAARLPDLDSRNHAEVLANAVAQGILNEVDAQALKAALDARLAVLQVDDFPQTRKEQAWPRSRVAPSMS